MNYITETMLGSTPVKIAAGHVYPADTDDELIGVVEGIMNAVAFAYVTIVYTDAPESVAGYLTMHQRNFTVGVANRRGVKHFIGRVRWGKVKALVLDREVVYSKGGV